MTRGARERSAAWLAAIVLLAFAARAAGAAPVRTLTIASTAAVADGRTYYTGVNGRVNEVGWLAAQLRARGVELQWMAVPSDVGATINEAFAGHRIDFARYGDLPSVILTEGTGP